MHWHILEKSADRISNRRPYPIGGDGNTIWASGNIVMDPDDHRIIGPRFCGLCG